MMSPSRRDGASGRCEQSEGSPKKLARSGAAAPSSFLFLSIGIAVALSILAAVVFKMRGFGELTALHVLYVAGFGWIVPMLWAR